MPRDNNKKKYLCSKTNCSAAFSRHDRLEIHMRTHTGERPYVCIYEDCFKSYTRASHLNRHEASHEEKPIKCSFDGCDVVLRNHVTMKKHVENQHKNLKPKSYKCHYCDKTFSRHNFVKMHEYKHTGVKPYVCSKEGCEKRFLAPSRLKRHMKVHEGYACSKCNPQITCLNWSLYLKHVKITHPTEHRCEKCLKTFSSSWNLEKHCKIHQDLLDRVVHFCSVPNCPRFYTEERNMKHHLRKYHEQRPFPCSHAGCALTFKNQDQLDRHHQIHDPSIPISSKKRKKKLKMRKRKKMKFAAQLAGYKGEEAECNSENETVKKCHTVTTLQEDDVEHVETVIQSDDIVLQSDDAVLQSDVTVLQSDDTVLQSDNPLLQSDDAVLQSDVVVLQSDSAILQSDNPLLQYDDAILQSDHTVFQSNDAVLQSDDAVFQSNDAVFQSNDAVFQSDDVILRSDNVITPSDVTAIGTDELICNNPTSHNNESSKNTNEITNSVQTSLKTTSFSQRNSCNYDEMDIFQENSLDDNIRSGDISSKYQVIEVLLVNT